MNTSLSITIGIGPEGARIRGVRFMKDSQIAERIIELSPQEIGQARDAKRIVSKEAELIINDLLSVPER